MIYLVRHGEAAASWGDHDDPGLSEKGKEQAEAVARTLYDLDAKAVVSSPMRRCQETATPLARKLDLPVITEPAISEIVAPPGTEDRVAWLQNLMAGNWPDKMTGWRQQAFEFLRIVPDQTAIFSHFVAINAVAGWLQQTDKVLVFRPDHCSLTTLERDGLDHLQIRMLGGEASTQIL